jgi:microcystin-dependent protein
MLGVQQNQALFSILGVAFGGDGVNTFGLPDLRGRVPVGAGNRYRPGQIGGEETHMLIPAEVTSHSHLVQGVSAAGTTPLLAGSLFATVDGSVYGPPTNLAPMSPGSVSTVGGVPHTNLQPYLVVPIAIALAGTIPSHN